MPRSSSGSERHRVIVYELDESQQRAGQAFGEFLRRLTAGDEHAFDVLRAAREKDAKDQAR